MPQAKMHRGKPAHRKTDNMGARYAKMIQDRGDIFGRLCLVIGRSVLGHVGRWISARVIGDATVAPREVPNLGLPTPAITGEFVHENNRVP